MLMSLPLPLSFPLRPFRYQRILTNKQSWIDFYNLIIITNEPQKGLKLLPGKICSYVLNFRDVQEHVHHIQEHVLLVFSVHWASMVQNSVHWAWHDPEYFTIVLMRTPHAKITVFYLKVVLIKFWKLGPTKSFKFVRYPVGPVPQIIL